VSVLLWLGKLWTAGDAKLFIAFVALGPFYHSGHQLLSILDMLINIFLPAMIAVLLLSAIRIVRFRPKKEVAKDLFREFTNPSRIAYLAVKLFALLWAVHLLVSFLGITTFWVQLAITVILASMLYRSRLLIVSAMFGLSRFLFDSSVYTPTFWYRFLLLLIVFMVLLSMRRGVIATFLSSIFSRHVPVAKLQPGMVANIKGKEVRLTNRDIAQLRRAGKPVEVDSTLPFAPFIFVGALLTLSLDGNVLILFFTL
jgi:hypothetical protein